MSFKVMEVQAMDEHLVLVSLGCILVTKLQPWVRTQHYNQSLFPMYICRTYNCKTCNQNPDHYRYIQVHIEIIRQHLISKGLLKSNQEKRICEPYSGRNFSRCDYCGVTQLCAVKVIFILFFMIKFLSALESSDWCYHRIF